MAEGSAEKREVEEYIAAHDLQSVLNDVVNATVAERPPAPLVFMRDLLAARWVCAVGRVGW